MFEGFGSSGSSKGTAKAEAAVLIICSVLQSGRKLNVDVDPRELAEFAVSTVEAVLERCGIEEDE